jgi:anti-sigma B factor antagonist
MEAHFNIEDHAGVQVIEVSTLITNEYTKDIILEVEQLIEKGNSHMVIDLNKLNYINSTGLSFLISTLTRCRNAGGEVAISNLSESIKKLLLLTRLQSAFSIHESNKSAVDFLKKN